jgi:hypothetical protein
MRGRRGSTPSAGRWRPPRGPALAATNSIVGSRLALPAAFVAAVAAFATSAFRAYQRQL